VGEQADGQAGKRQQVVVFKFRDKNSAVSFFLL
jgi:hypothetical protein